MSALTAQDVMTTTPIMVSEEMRLFEIAGLFRSRRISGAPVVNDEGKLIGVVTVTDLFRYIDDLRQKAKGSSGLLLDQLKEQRLKGRVRDVMTRGVMTVKRETPLVEILDMMMSKTIHTIPVMTDDDKEIIGIVGRHDLALACLMGQWAV